MTRKIASILFIILVALTLTSCQITKYVPDGQYLLYKVKILPDTKNVKSYDIQPYLRQMPNPKLFDAIPFNLGLYSLSSPDTALWINRFLRKVGDAPVIYDSTLTKSSELELKRYMENKGYGNAVVTSDVKYKKKKAYLTFHIKAGDPYKIHYFRYGILDDSLKQVVLSDSANTLIKPGDNFDIDVLESERIRITKLLKNNGYYEFDKEYVGVIADSTIGNHQVDLMMYIKPMRRIIGREQYTTESHAKYTIRDIHYITLEDYTQILDTAVLSKLKQKSYKNITINSNVNLIRPYPLYIKTLLDPGMVYNESLMDKTYAKLSSMHIFKYLNIETKQVGDSANRQLDCYVYMTPDKVQSLSAQIEGTNNEGDFGLAGKLTYAHGNIFRGGEVFKFSIRGGNESIIGKRSIWDVATEASIGLPMLLCPFLKRDFLRNNNTNTEIYANFSYQIRADYSRIIAGTGIRYKWNDKKDISHQFDLFDFNYVYLPYMSNSLKKTINSSLLKYSYEDHLIMRIGYTIAYSNKKSNSLQNNYSVRCSAETSGNLLYGISAATNANKNSNDSYLVGRIPFAQYVKMDFDFAFRHVVDSKNMVVYHIGLGVGIPYLNSNILPFEKRYYGGGANSVRGWSARSLGPGNYSSRGSNIDYMKQSGDINLNINIEYRTKLVWKLELAAFLDAGNIWTLNDEGTAEGQFKFNRFYKQIAFGYGIGLRLNFDFFVVRLDWGLKAYDPARPSGEQWRFVPGWKITEDTALHFAVGFPF
ncbi:MAG: BamA/TamA family outer membrane protein [Paludibacteraceae bacterium]|nr:BamA/TamA family outer membrane protein [Paludibacteraceae bacterium]